MENFEKYAMIMQTVKNFHTLSRNNIIMNCESINSTVMDAISLTYDDIQTSSELNELDIAFIFWIILRSKDK